MIRLSLLPWSQQLVLGIPLFVLLSLSALSDFREQKIPNKLTYPGIVLGIVMSFIIYGVWDGFFNLGVVLIVFFIGFITMIAGMLGGGDVKLFMAIGAFVGLQGVAQVVFYSFIVGFGLALAYSVASGYLWQMLRNMIRILKAVFRMLYYRTTNVSYGLKPSDSRSKIPFGVAIFAGTILAYTEAQWSWPHLWEWLQYHIG